MDIRARLQGIKHSFFTRLSYLIPKRKGLIIFYPTHNRSGFSGNLKSFFIYLNSCPERSRYLPIWCTDNQETYDLLKSQGYRVTKNKIDNYLQLLRAQHIIQDSTHILLTGNFSIIQLWHGNGFKNSALLDTTNTLEMRALLRKAYKHYRIIAASSKVHQELMIRSFENENVRIVGSPKNDVFYEGPQLVDKIKKEYGLEKFSKIFAYTPTFRDIGAFAPFPQQFWDVLNPWLIENNAVFVVKKHPWDKTLVIPENFENIKDVTTTFSDAQELLLVADVLISDYSAIVTDFAITGKPIIYYFHDYENYTDIRSFYYDLKKVLPGPFVYDSKSLLACIQDLSWFSEPDYQVEFKKFLTTFHTYMDGNSSRRVFQEMEKLS
jgi:CDP-glycerol glycerophosphotransferase (TagB/SpsB family)